MQGGRVWAHVSNQPTSIRLRIGFRAETLGAGLRALPKGAAVLQGTGLAEDRQSPGRDPAPPSLAPVSWQRTRDCLEEIGGSRFP